MSKATTCQIYVVSSNSQVCPFNYLKIHLLPQRQNFQSSTKTTKFWKRCKSPRVLHRSKMHFGIGARRQSFCCLALSTPKRLLLGIVNAKSPKRPRQKKMVQILALGPTPKSTVQRQNRPKSTVQRQSFPTPDFGIGEALGRSGYIWIVRSIFSPMLSYIWTVQSILSGVLTYMGRTVHDIVMSGI